jgi:hypothetical protein
MRTRLATTSLLLFTCALPARAEHGDPFVVTSPAPSETLPANGRLRLISDNGPHPLVVEHGSYAFRLRSGPRTVPLRAEDLREGFDWDGYGSSSVRLVPSTALRVGERYRLEIRDGRGPWEAFPQGADEPDEWTVGPSDHERPTWTGTLGEDPVYPPTPRLTATIRDQSPVALRIDVTDATGTTHRELTAFTEDAEGCSGFDAGEPPPLRIRAYPIDAAGLRGEERTFTITEPLEYVRVCLVRAP